MSRRPLWIVIGRGSTVPPVRTSGRAGPARVGEQLLAGVLDVVERRLDRRGRFGIGGLFENLHHGWNSSMRPEMAGPGTGHKPRGGGDERGSVPAITKSGIAASEQRGKGREEREAAGRREVGA